MNAPYIDNAQAEIAQVAHAQEVVPIELPGEAEIKKALEMEGGHGGQCVEFIQRLFESYYTHPDFRGIAEEIKPNATTSEIGYAVLTNEGPHGHAALVIDKIASTSEIVICESNYSKHDDEIVTCGRRLKESSERIVGYFKF